MDPVIRIDSDQMSVERGMMSLLERKPVRDYRLSKSLIPVSDADVLPEACSLTLAQVVAAAFAAPQFAVAVP